MNEKKTNAVERFFEKFDATANFVGLVITILSIFIGAGVGANIVAKNINANINNSTNANTATSTVNVDTIAKKSVEEQLYAAQQLYDAEDYGVAMQIYQGIRNESSTAALNIGYLYSKGLGVEKNTSLASKYYKQAYEMGNELGLQNYISVNLTSPTGYGETLDALKYGYEQHNKTAIEYLSICSFGKMKDTTFSELKQMADSFMAYDTDEQLAKLKPLLKMAENEIEYYVEGKQPPNSEFSKYILLNNSAIKIFLGYSPMIHAETDEMVIEQIYSVKETSAYRKDIYNFYLSGYFPADEFDRV